MGVRGPISVHRAAISGARSYPLRFWNSSAKRGVQIVPADMEIEFIGKEEIESLASFARIAVLEWAEERLGVFGTGARIHRIQ